MRTLRTAPLIALLLAAQACGGDEGTDVDAGTDAGTDESGGDTTTPDEGSADVVEDTGSDDTAEPDGSGDVVDDTGGEDTTPETSFEAENFFECEIDSDCPADGGREQICVFHVCVIPPTVEGNVADDEGIQPVEYADRAPVTSCYTDAALNLYTPAGDDRDVTMYGKLKRFGSGPVTTGLCVSIYDEEVLLPWQVNSECNLLAEGDDTPYIACFQLDPCRCQEFVDGAQSGADVMVEAAEAALAAAGTPGTISDLNDCFGFIGYCEGITDATKQTACRDRVRAHGMSTTAESLILSVATTTEDPAPDEVDESKGSSLFEVSGVPTNRRIAMKVSGRENRWRDTWRYGYFIRGDRVDTEGRYESTATVLGDGSWRTIPAAVGLAAGIDDRNGAVAGVIRDCGDEGRNPWAIVHATVGISFNQDSVLAYFNDNPDNTLPLPGRIDTNLLGTYAAINLPPGPNRVAPIICVDDCSNRENFVFAGGQNVFQTPKSVIIATFEGFFESR